MVKRDTNTPMNNLLSYIDTSKKKKPKKESEKDTEKYLKRRVKEVFNGAAFKFTSPSHRSVPDQIIFIPCEFLPAALTVLVEVKSSDGKVTAMQADEHRRLADLGCLVYVVYSRDDVERLLFDVGQKLVRIKLASVL